MIEKLDVYIDLPIMRLVEYSIKKSFAPDYNSFNSETLLFWSLSIFSRNLALAVNVL